MRITLNLAVAPTLRERYALAWAAPTTLVALVVMVWMAHSTWVNVREARRIEPQVAEAELREQALIRREMELRRAFEQPATRSLLEKTQFINGLIDKKRLSFTALTMKVADLLPPDARLAGVALARLGDSSTVRFQVNGKTPQALETFLSNLASSPDFAEPVVTSEGFEQPQGTTGASAGEVTVTCTARYVGPPTDAGASTAADTASHQPSDKTNGKARLAKGGESPNAK